jgi:hypothetical protein
MSDMHITERELLAMVDSMKDAHADSMPAFHAGLADLTDAHADAARANRTSRRTILMAGGVALGGAALAACGSSKKSSTGTTTPTTAAGSASAAGATGYTGDFKVVALASALENAAVYAYTTGITAATAGKLGTVPPAVVTFATTAKAQHTDHGQGWNAFLVKNKLKAVTDIPLTIVPTVMKDLAAVKTVTDLANFALFLEDAAAATYITAAAGVSAQQGIDVATTIAPVEAQHAAILNFVLGKYPVPDALYSIKGAVPVSAFTG